MDKSSHWKLFVDDFPFFPDIFPAMFEYRRVDFLFVLAVKFWLQIGWGKGFHELSSNERTAHVTVDARTARSNRRSKMTWQSFFFGHHWQSLTYFWMASKAEIPYLGGWTSRIYTIFWEDLIIFKSWTSVKTRGWTSDAALPHCHRMFVQGDVLTEDWSDASAAQLNWGSWWPLRETLSHYISHKKSPYVPWSKVGLAILNGMARPVHFPLGFRWKRTL